MDQGVRDILMQISIKDSTVGFEGQAEISTDDGLARGFISPSAANKWQSNFCVLRSFKTNIELKDGERNKGGKSRNRTSFGGFIGAGIGVASTPYSSNFEKIEISKLLDVTSISLFMACIGSKTIASASIIKRRGSGGTTLSTYLRMDFKNLMITDFNWDEDDVINEKLNLICESVNVRYKIESDSGKLSNLVTQHGWSAITG